LGIRSRALQGLLGRGIHALSPSETQFSVTSPYRGIEPFRYVDRANFFGRAGAIEELFAKILLYRLVVLFGESGSGKSSLLNAGLIPTMQKEGLRPERLRVRPDPDAPITVERVSTTHRRDRDFLPSIFSDVGADYPSSPTIACSISSFLLSVRASAAGSRPLLIFDQFEELFTLFEQKTVGGKELQLRVLETLFHIVNDQELRAKVVIVIREDFLGKLEILVRSYPQVLDHRVRLRYLAKDHARDAILGPFGIGNVLPSRLSADLASQIVSDLSTDMSDGLVAPTQVQIICSRLWKRYSGAQVEIGLPEYNTLGGATGIVRGFFESELLQFDQSLRSVAITMLGSLITVSGTRDVVSEEKLRDIASRHELKPEDTTSALGTLEVRRLINKTSQRGTYFYEVSSEYLIPPIQKESRQLAAERAEKKAAAEGAEREREASRARDLERAKSLAEEQERRADAERLRAEEQARHARRLRRLSRSLAVAFMLALAAGVLAYWQSTVAMRNEERAKRNENQALANAKLAQDRQHEAEAAQRELQQQKEEAISTTKRAQKAESLAETRLKEAETARAAALQNAQIARQQTAQAQTARVTGSAILSVAWSPDGRELVTGSQDTTAIVWDVTTGRALQTLSGQTASVSSVAWSPDGKRIATGSGDNTARIWDAQTGKDLLVLKGHTDAIYSVAWSPNGTELATGSGDNTAKVWHSETGQEVITLRGHTGAVYSVAWSPDGYRLATAGLDGIAIVWVAARAEKLVTISGISKGSLTSIYSVAWSPVREWLATAGQSAIIWDGETGKELTLLFQAAPVDTVAWSPDGKWVATGSLDGSATIFEAASGQVIRVLRGHKGSVISVSWSPDGKRLASASEDRTAKVWDAETGLLLLSLTVPPLKE
jgi:WD40 repeat protein